MFDHEAVCLCWSYRPSTATKRMRDAAEPGMCGAADLWNREHKERLRRF